MGGAPSTADRVALPDGLPPGHSHTVPMPTFRDRATAMVTEPMPRSTVRATAFYSRPHGAHAKPLLRESLLGGRRPTHTQLTEVRPMPTLARRLVDSQGKS